MNISRVPKRSPGSPGQRESQPGQVELERIFGGPIVDGPARMADRPRLFHGKSADHLWCTCCKRTFPNGIYRQVGDFRRCPYADCSGHASVDAMPWERIKASNPDYPNVPLAGTHYPLVMSVVPAARGLSL